VYRQKSGTSSVPLQEQFMADKSPRQTASKKSGKSIKEKRADKKAASAPASSLDITSSKAAKKK
jgi:hypothetical protein